MHVTRIRTPLTESIGIDIPIVQAPMSSAATPTLAAAVSNAGGLGMISGTWLAADELRRLIREVKSQTEHPFGVNLGLDWAQEERLGLCLEEGVPVISLFWGDPTPYVRQAHDGGAVVLHTVGSSEQARSAVDAGVDVLVAQGWEAGGHVDSMVGNLALIPAVVDVAGAVPVVAAGGIADGRALAAVLALGAAGAWVGTRFLLTHEARAHEHYKSRLLSATESDTVFSTVFDVGWPDAPHRTLRNATVDMWEAAGRPEMRDRAGEEQILGEYDDGTPIVRYAVDFPRPGASGDVDAMALYAGQGVGQTTSIQPAADVVRDLAREAHRILLETSGQFAPE
jgi:NAD(P)H-dependent flavin oxidoreductase YrpB (nitropropane dioxygenase family)